MANRISSFKRSGRAGYRYRKQIRGRVYERYFYGNREQREHEYKKWVADLESKYLTRDWDNSLTWTAFSEKFMVYIRTLTDKGTGKSKYKTRTIQEYEYSLLDFEEIMQPRYMADIEYYTLAEYRRRLRARADEEKDNYYGVNKKMGCIIRALKWGMAEGYAPLINTAPLEKNLDTGKIIVRTVGVREVALLIKYSSLKWKVGIKLGFYTGMRPEEAINLLVSKINFKTGVCKICEHSADKSRGVTEWSPKRDKRRLVLLPPDLLEDIKKLNPKTYVLSNDRGTKYEENNFSNSFKINLKHVNREILHHEPDTAPITCTYKTLRKSNITALMDMGLEEEVASLSLGHADKKTSERHYINADVLAKQQEREQLARLEKIKSYIYKLPDAIK